MSRKKRRTSLIVWLRRACQTAFLIFFFYLFFQTIFHPNYAMDYPVKFFFQIDPLVMIGTWMASHAIPIALLFSLITLAATIVFGRWFCGWICPFGAIHNFFTSLRQRKLKKRMESASYSTSQRIKYYVLTVFLAGAMLGWNAVGWVDPFSFLYRSIATSIYPALNWLAAGLFAWLYQADPGVGPIRATVISEPIYDLLRNRTGLVTDVQPYFWGSMLIGVLFIIVVLLNLYRARFWCRYICPLGALLGVAGKNPAFRLKKDEELCNGCNICVADCQGGAEPHKMGGWKPSECFYCWNCKPSCPSNAISFFFETPIQIGKAEPAVTLAASSEEWIEEEMEEIETHEASAPIVKSPKTTVPKTGGTSRRKQASKKKSKGRRS
ncbi:MAG: 4Fe-4S binding protein [Candidatus Omnitrophota bacterium]